MCVCISGLAAEFSLERCEALGCCVMSCGGGAGCMFAEGGCGGTVGGVEGTATEC